MEPSPDSEDTFVCGVPVEIFSDIDVNMDHVVEIAPDGQIIGEFSNFFKNKEKRPRTWSIYFLPSDRYEVQVSTAGGFGWLLLTDFIRQTQRTRETTFDFGSKSFAAVLMQYGLACVGRPEASVSAGRLSSPPNFLWFVGSPQKRFPLAQDQTVERWFDSGGPIQALTPIRQCTAKNRGVLIIRTSQDEKRKYGFFIVQSEITEVLTLLCGQTLPLQWGRGLLRNRGVKRRSRSVWMNFGKLQ